jgi:hypothetical protein
MPSKPFEPGNKHAFKPGQSGNPGGIPKDVWAAMKLASSSCLEMIELHLWIARNVKAPLPVRQASANSVLDRGGMAKALNVQHSLNQDDLRQFTNEQLIAIILGDGSSVAATDSGEDSVGEKVPSEPPRRLQ